MKRRGFLMADGVRVRMRGAKMLAIAVHTCGIIAVRSAVAQAADAWPTPGAEWLSRDAGGGLAIPQMILWWAWIAAWATSSDWAFRDSQRHKVRPEFWTMSLVFPFVACSLLAWWIPWSAAGQALMVVAWLVPLFVYGRERNPKAPPAESIFTVGHLQRTFAAALSKLGVKSKATKVVDTGLPWVTLVATGGETPEDNAKWQQEASAMPGFEPLKKLLGEAVAARSSRLVLETAAEGFRVGHEVDGMACASRAVQSPAKGTGKSKQPEVWADAPPLDATVGNAAISVLRTIAGADAATLSGEHEASFTIDVDGKKRPCRLSTRAVKASKQVIVAMEMAPYAPKKLEDLGMSAGTAKRVRDLIALEKGLFIVSSPVSSGCSTTFDMVLTAADRLLRDFVSIEDSDNPPSEVQNVKPMRYSSRIGDAPISALNTAMLEYPRAVVTRDLSDKELAAKLVELANDQQLVIVSLRANDALDAVQKLLDLGIGHEPLARCLLGSLSQRLIRKLCPQCGEKIPTPPELLQRFKMTAEEVPEIKRVSPHGGCRACAGRQFVGRTAIFELAAGPTVRQALAKQGDAKALRQAAVSDGMRPLSEEGVAAVIAGVSSLDEVQRALAAKKESAKESGAKESGAKESGAAAAAKAEVRPATKQASKPVTKPASKPVTKPASKPDSKSATKPGTQSGDKK